MHEHDAIWKQICKEGDSIRLRVAVKVETWPVSLEAPAAHKLYQVESTCVSTTNKTWMVPNKTYMYLDLLITSGGYKHAKKHQRKSWIPNHPTKK